MAPKYLLKVELRKDKNQNKVGGLQVSKKFIEVLLYRIAVWKPIA